MCRHVSTSCRHRADALVRLSYIRTGSARASRMSCPNRRCSRSRRVSTPTRSTLRCCNTALFRAHYSTIPPCCCHRRCRLRTPRIRSLRCLRTRRPTLHRSRLRQGRRLCRSMLGRCNLRCHADSSRHQLQAYRTQDLDMLFGRALKALPVTATIPNPTPLLVSDDDLPF